MAIVCNEYFGKPNLPTCNFVVDTIAELDDLPTMTKKASGSFSDFPHFAPLGSTCLCCNDGNVKTYTLFSKGWVEV